MSMIDIVLTALEPSEPTQQPWGEYANSEALIRARTQAFEHGQLVCVSDEASRSDAQVVTNLEGLVRVLANQIHEDTLALIWDLEQPLLSSELIDEAVRRFQSCLADLIDADFYPEGIAPFAATGYAFKTLLQTEAPDEPASLDGLKRWFRREINRFDVELLMAEQDYRHLRASVSLASRRGERTARAFASHLDSLKDGLSLDGFAEQIHQDPTIIRPCPSYIELEITSHCEHACTHCPRNVMDRDPQHMPYDTFKKLIDELASWAGDATLVFGYMGEPTEHPDLVRLIRTVGETSLKLLIETHGLNLSEEILAAIAENPRAHVLISLDGSTAMAHEASRPNLPFAEIEKRAAAAFRELPSLAHLQFLRTTSNDQEAYRFMDRWRAHEDQLIVLPKNTYQGRVGQDALNLPAPPQRFPCVHLSRDMNILADGRVVMCKQDFRGDHIMGQFPDQTLQAIWATMNDVYTQDFQGKVPEFCAGCDQWFQFND